MRRPQMVTILRPNDGDSYGLDLSTGCSWEVRTDGRRVSSRRFEIYRHPRFPVIGMVDDGDVTPAVYRGQSLIFEVACLT
jgi:hypothetical protein